MARYGPQFGPDITSSGSTAATGRRRATYADADVVILGAPFDGGRRTAPAPGSGPQVIRQTDYLPTTARGRRWRCGSTGCRTCGCYDAGDVEMFSGDAARSVPRPQAAVYDGGRATARSRSILGGDHTIAWPDAAGVAQHLGQGRVSMIHFDAHADTGDIEFGSLIGHGQPMRRLIESGAVRGDRFLQIGLRGYWPAPETLDWMAEQGMRSYEMTEIGERGLDDLPDRGVRDRHRRLRRGVPVGRHRRVRPGPRAGDRHPGAGRADRAPAARRGAAHRATSCRSSGIDVVEVSPPYDHADITAFLANRVVLEVLSGIARRRRDAASGATWDRMRPLLDGR